MSAPKDNHTMSTIILEMRPNDVPEKMRNARAIVNMMEVFVFLFEWESKFLRTIFFSFLSFHPINKKTYTNSF